MNYIISLIFFICLLTLTTSKAALDNKIKGRGDLKAKLQGIWNCTSSKSNKKFSLPFSPTDGYLRFIFKGSRIFIANSPIDRGRPFIVKFEENSFLIKQEYKEEIKFYIEKITHNELSLLLTNDNDEIIRMAFTRPEDREKTMTENQEPILSLTVAIVVYDDPEIAILNRYANQFTINSIKSYSLLNRKLNNYVDGIQFKTKKAESFDAYLAKAMDLKSLLRIDSINNKLIVEFEILKKDIINIKFINLLSYPFSNQI
ncbi:MAG: hypothetical protein O9262_00540, partial [Cyclobacteriaceae bacterium]|nr:hypothetical protein [Cyclobacteriaceae bacterium]